MLTMSESGPSIAEQIEAEYVRIEKRRLFDQKPLPGLEDYVCTFDCLEHCPLAGNHKHGIDDHCFYWDTIPLYVPEIEYPEFEDWRELHEGLVKPEPTDPLQTRCPRCFSTEVTIGYLYLECRNCDYNEPLRDFPENIGREMGQRHA